MFITHQDESHRITGYKKDGRWTQRGGKGKTYQLGKLENWNFQHAGHKGKNHSTNTIFRPRRMATL